MAETVFENLDALRAAVGRHLGHSDWLEVTQDRIDLFADATGDHQWIHVDPEKAAAGPFGTTIAHGYLTLSLLPLLGQHQQGIQLDLPARMRVNYGLNRVRFPAPVRVGKRIRLRSTLLSVEPVGDGVYQLVYRQTVEIEDEAKPAMVAETVSRLYL